LGEHSKTTELPVKKILKTLCIHPVLDHRNLYDDTEIILCANKMISDEWFRRLAYHARSSDVPKDSRLAQAISSNLTNDNS